MSVNSPAEPFTSAVPVPHPADLPGEFVYDASRPHCPARELLDQISTKWANLSLIALAAGPRRYSDITRFMPGASKKMITQTLRMLERNGMVTRTITPAVPVRVDYELTALGRSLLPLVWAIKVWSESNMDEVAAARGAYDAENAERPAVHQLTQAYVANRRGERGDHGDRDAAG